MKNFLYTMPEYYENVYAAQIAGEAEFLHLLCDHMFGNGIESVLDVGCGTGRTLHLLEGVARNRMGFDVNTTFIDYAKQTYADCEFWEQSMLEETLPAKDISLITMLGSVIMYCRSNEELLRVFRNCRSWLGTRGRLLIGLANSMKFVHADIPDSFSEFTVEVGETVCRAHSSFTVNPGRQSIVRKRKWDLGTGEEFEDDCEFRLLFPKELEFFLTVAGFRSVSFYDAGSTDPAGFGGSRLYVVGDVAEDG